MHFHSNAARAPDIPLGPKVWNHCISAQTPLRLQTFHQAHYIVYQFWGLCSLISLGHWGDAPSLRSVTGGMLHHFTQSLGDAPSLRSVAGGCSPTSLSCWGDAPLLRSVAGGRSIASLGCWRDAPLLCSVAGGTLLCFAQSLGGCSLALLSCWGDALSL